MWPLPSSKDWIAVGRFFHSKLCFDLHVDDALVCRVIIVFVGWFCIVYAFLMSSFGFLEHCFVGFIGSDVFGGVSF